MQKFCACECYYTDNIFIEEYKLHVRFVSEDQFRKDYQHILRSQGCTTGPQLHTVLEKVQAEVERRKNIAVQSAERRATIKETYKPLHENVYRLQESHLAPEFLEIVKYCHMDGANEKGLLALLTTEAAPRVYRFPVFTKDFCRDLVEELEHFEQSDAPKGRPNTMNNYGVLLDELGLDEGLVGPLREEYLRPLSALLYPDCGGRWLDSHKAFAVKYAVHEDVELSYHYDNAEVTLNVSLGKDFTGGNLYFGDMRQVPLCETECVEVEHQVTRALMHRGQHMHGALPVLAGCRWNLVVWMRASCQRNHLCPMCDARPRLRPAPGHGGGFTAEPGQEGTCALT
ncbi:2-oxoglutarate and iron-dependent oxygenase domain-containing protein 2 isoform X2 [Electrophorus electricus]|uniref:Fe2OG dioxygenase domain-containing protein n=1 Tax=Electrophorus electricus TaxID=8005 RepID=A0A4W4G2C5_ELEEL|nr:2-oxoglutarate and iron-dependent oxygenase domain-containing protein 2 isoform X2 [Electrophorus electricus]